ncbi:unnamed protein product [Moneuplotes crassus]|uniref:Uncharacterized protein n=1 Tax=Euplotes crassus TaxID=5936 RepID=A0AAD2DA98_EUPCR|nr:unnamed protein product [Moneuplotes crassus]
MSKTDGQSGLSPNTDAILSKPFENPSKTNPCSTLKNTESLTKRTNRHRYTGPDSIERILSLIDHTKVLKIHSCTKNQNQILMNIGLPATKEKKKRFKAFVMKKEKREIQKEQEEISQMASEPSKAVRIFDMNRENNEISRKKKRYKVQSYSLFRKRRKFHRRKESKGSQFLSAINSVRRRSDSCTSNDASMPEMDSYRSTFKNDHQNKAITSVKKFKVSESTIKSSETKKEMAQSKSKILEKAENLNMGEYITRNRTQILDNTVNQEKIRPNFMNYTANIDQFLNIKEHKKERYQNSNLMNSNSQEIEVLQNLYTTTQKIIPEIIIPTDISNSLTWEEVKSICDRIVELCENSNLNKKRILELYSIIEEKFETHKTPVVRLLVKKIKAEILIEFRDFQECVILLHRCIDFCEKHKMYREEISILNQLGVVYRFQKKYQLSIQFHILQLELSWDQKDMVNEMTAYENICMSYYYLGKIQNAMYFMKRVIEGDFEPDNSVVKRIASTMVKNAREKLKSQGYRHLIEEYEQGSKRSDFRLSKVNSKQKSSFSELVSPDREMNMNSKSSSQLMISPSLKPGGAINASADFTHKKSLLFSPVIPLGQRRSTNFSFAAAKKPKTQYLKGKSRISYTRMVVRPTGKPDHKRMITNIFNKYSLQ